jgi:hypothetical protein
MVVRLSKSPRRRRATRCEARMVEQPYSWQCELQAGHSGDHVSEHRRWRADGLARVTERLWRRQH